MCGMIGYYNGNLNKKLFNEMLNRIKSRGPDQQKLLVMENAGLGFCRLAINDITSGEQPVQNSNKSITLIFNGEIYNYPKIRQQLNRLGHTVNSEAEALLQLYIKHGESFMQLLDGDFAIVIIDANNSKCLLIRDAIGIKPLYYSHSNQYRPWLFASHIAGLFSSKCLDDHFDEVALLERKILGYWSSDRTLFNDIKQVQPGEIVIIKNHTMNRKRWARCKKPTNKSHDLTPAIHDTLKRATNKRISHSSVYPIFNALSGGIDSTVLSILCNDQLQDIKNITIYDNLQSNDCLYSDLLHHALQMPTIIKKISPKSVFSQLPELILADGGYGPSYSVFFLSQAIKQNSPATKVLLCGEGADEFFHGYSVHRNLELHWQNHKNNIDKSDRVLIEHSNLLKSFYEKKNGQNKAKHLALLLQHEQLEIRHLMPFEHATMYHGLECRLPYLDTEVLGLLQSIPINKLINANYTKLPLRDIIKHNLNRYPKLANALLNRRKEPAYYAIRSMREKLLKYINYHIPASNLYLSPLYTYAANAEDLFWLTAMKIIFCEYYANIDELNEHQLFKEVFTRDWRGIKLSRYL